MSVSACALPFCCWPADGVFDPQGGMELCSVQDGRCVAHSLNSSSSSSGGTQSAAHQTPAYQCMTSLLRTGSSCLAFTQGGSGGAVRKAVLVLRPPAGDPVPYGVLGMVGGELLVQVLLYAGEQCHTTQAASGRAGTRCETGKEADVPAAAGVCPLCVSTLNPKPFLLIVDSNDYCSWVNLLTPLAIVGSANTPVHVWKIQQVCPPAKTPPPAVDVQPSWAKARRVSGC